MAAALEHFPENAVAASALMGALQCEMGIFGSALAGIFNDVTPEAMGYVITLMSIAGLLSAVFLMPRQRAITMC
jgi:vacuolar-type H+-ATPase subunit I/STV1